MMNDPREDESKHFDMAKFSYFDFTPDRLKTYQMIRTYVDPAGGENPGQMRRGKRDWCAIVTCGRTADGYLDILDVVMTREAPDRQIARVLDVYAAFGSRRIGVEENMWKNLVQPTFANIARSRGLYPSIHTVHTTSNKVQRILSIQPLIESGVIRFARHLLDKVPDYFAQFDEFPGDFDDGPDATEGVIRMLEISRGSMGTFIPMAHTSYWRNRA
jgi:predicted phage terminase large subunit-like protein